jgi:hypothetical protein
MPLQREVILTVDQDGNVEMEVKGVKGPSCADLTRDVEKALGNVTSKKSTAEAFQASSTQKVTQKHGGG